MDLSSVIMILSFIALNNCLNIEGKIVFSKGFKCHLWIDQIYFFNLTLKIHSKNVLLPLKSKKRGILLRVFFVFFYLHSKITLIPFNA
jgi:hypothetical protein